MEFYGRKKIRHKKVAATRIQNHKRKKKTQVSGGSFVFIHEKSRKNDREEAEKISESDIFNGDDLSIHMFVRVRVNTRLHIDD